MIIQHFNLDILFNQQSIYQDNEQLFQIVNQNYWILCFFIFFLLDNFQPQSSANNSNDVLHQFVVGNSSSMPMTSSLPTTTTTATTGNTNNSSNGDQCKSSIKC